MKILFSGGGTIGSVSPLIAVYEEIKKQKPDTEFLWLATRNGPEIQLVSNYQIPIKHIFSGKFRRYFSFKNFIDPFFVFLGFVQSFFIIIKFKPDAILSAGGFVSVPVTWAGKILRKPCLIHQQDIRPGLANKMMANSAKIITVTFQKSLNDFPKGKTVLTGNPVRADILTGDKEEAYKFFGFTPTLPTILIMGGGTGAAKFNQLVLDSLEQLVTFCQVIHLTGGKNDKVAEHPNYRSYDFLTEQMKHAYAVADLVVSRAGMSALTELSVLGKAAIVIPIAGSHQEENAVEFFKNNAILMVEEKNLNPEGFTVAIRELLSDHVQLDGLRRNIKTIMPSDAASRIVKIII